MVFVSKTSPGRRPQLGPPYAAAAFGTFSTGVFGRGAAFSVHAVRKRLGQHSILESGGYPLVNIQKTMERSTQSPIYSWEKPLFRLGHFPCRFLHVYQSVSRHRWSLGPFNQIAVHRSRGPRKTPKQGCKTSPASSVVDVPKPQKNRVPIIRYTQNPVARGNFPTISKGQFKWACVISHLTASSGQITAAHPVKIPILKTSHHIPMKISIVVGKIFAREKSSCCRANLSPKLFPLWRSRHRRGSGSRHHRSWTIGERSTHCSTYMLHFAGIFPYIWVT